MIHMMRGIISFSRGDDATWHYRAAMLHHAVNKLFSIAAPVIRASNCRVFVPTILNLFPLD